VLVAVSVVLDVCGSVSVVVSVSVLVAADVVLDGSEIAVLVTVSVAVSVELLSPPPMQPARMVNEAAPIVVSAFRRVCVESFIVVFSSS